MSVTDLSWEPSRFAVSAKRRADGTILLTPDAPLGPYPERVTDMLDHWAVESPNRTLIARRDIEGEWVSVTYREALDRVRLLAAGLAGLGLDAERPLLILSGNGIEHLLLSLAAMYIGVPYCPVSPAYSRPGSEFAKLGYVIDLLTPGLVATFGEAGHASVVESIVPDDVAVVADISLDTPHRTLSLRELETSEEAGVEQLHAGVSADTIAKFLLTSGSTGQPKPVITTNRMLCSNQVMLRQAVPFVADEPPVLVDWLPWNHTFGGSHNVGLVLFNGGTLYVDDGKPVPGLFDETLQNLREISPTVYFNVPKGFEILGTHLQEDDELRHNFYRSLRACFFAGASLTQHTWDLLDETARRERATRVPMISGLGCTETSPSVSFTTPGNERAGVIGLPADGNIVKLAPVADKLELRVKGPNVTPGYWRLPDETAKAFDAEGYYRLGDAVRLVDPEDAAKGMIFDGRIAEDFKLASGTWVSVGPLRASLLAALAPFAQDVVIAGLDRDYVGILIVPDISACRLLAEAGDAIPLDDVLRSPALCTRITESLRAHARANCSGSRHAKRAIVLIEPLSIDLGEITDKGSVNQRTVLHERESLVTDLYAEPPPNHVLVAVDHD